MTFIDLFAGIGGFRLALESLGLECVFSSEIDPHCQQLYQANFGEYPAGDITTIPETSIPRHDVLCAGFPCQSFSSAGYRDGLEGRTGKLFFEIARIVKRLKPKVLLLENVPLLVSIDNGQVIKTIKDTLTLLGYTLHQNVLNSSFFGIPQRRIRWYGVAIRNDLGWTYQRPQETYEQICLHHVLIPDSILDAGLEANCRECKSAIVDKKTIKHIEWKDNSEYIIQVPLLHLFPIGYLNGLHMQGYRIYSPLGHATTLLHKSGGVGSQTALDWITIDDFPVSWDYEFFWNDIKQYINNRF